MIRGFHSIHQTICRGVAARVVYVVVRVVVVRRVGVVLKPRGERERRLLRRHLRHDRSSSRLRLGLSVASSFAVVVDRPRGPDRDAAAAAAAR